MRFKSNETLNNKKTSHHQRHRVFIHLPERHLVAHTTSADEQVEGTAGRAEGRLIFLFTE